MLKIGIVDITTVGSAICQRQIAELGGPDANHPEFFVHSFPFSAYKPAIILEDWEKLAELILSSINVLVKVGVSFVIIPSNTPHYAYDILSKKSPVPILDITEITADECQRNNLHNVNILGTNATMMSGLYLKKLEERGINLVVPSNTVCTAVHDFIMDEIIPNRVSAATRENVLSLLKEIECDGYILGCTELPEVYSTEDFGKPAIDTTRLLAKAAFQTAVSKNNENVAENFNSAV